MDRFDVIIVGGGISGLGVALEASNWGFDTLLVERGACCGATSANSLRIIHGGLRYLQSLNLPRVVRSIDAQDEILARWPALVSPLPCLMPLSARGMRSRLPARAAVALYKALYHARRKHAYAAGVLSASETAAACPLLAGRSKHGALMWTDGLVNDPAALSSAVKELCLSSGARILDRTEVVRIRKAGADLLVSLRSGAETSEARARVVVNAAGPWIDELRSRCEDLEPRDSYSWCLAFNLILKRRLEERYAVGFKTSEGRLFFLVPRGERSVLGTGYLALEPGKSKLVPNEQELIRFISSFNAGMGEPLLSLDDIDSVEGGVLPASGVRGGEPQLYGSERIAIERRYLEILSTKYTTFIGQGRQALAKAAKVLEESMREL